MVHAGIGEGWQDMGFSKHFWLWQFDVTNQLGEDTMIVLTLKMKLFYVDVPIALAKFKTFSFDPKCGITLVHSLKTIWDDW